MQINRKQYVLVLSSLLMVLGILRAQMDNVQIQSPVEYLVSSDIRVLDTAFEASLPVKAGIFSITPSIENLDIDYEPFQPADTLGVSRTLDESRYGLDLGYEWPLPPNGRMTEIIGGNLVLSNGSERGTIVQIRIPQHTTTVSPHEAASLSS